MRQSSALAFWMLYATGIYWVRGDLALTAHSLGSVFGAGIAPFLIWLFFNSKVSRRAGDISATVMAVLYLASLYQQ